MLRVLPALAFGFSLARGDVIPQDIADRFGAKCLNGAAPSYEITRNVSSTKWVLFLEGGGWCYGRSVDEATKSCAARGGFIWPPSSAHSGYENDGEWPMAHARIADIGGIMAQDPMVNPDFYTWNKVFMHYCDGASFGGGRTDPISVSKGDGSPGELWLRGRNNFNAVIDYLQVSQGMSSATEVILSGGSAGGLAVFYNLDHLATLLPKGVRLTGFPDAGFFLDGRAANTGDHTYRGNFQGADPVWNVTGSGGTNLKCLAAHEGEEWKCLMAPYIAPYIETPIYVMNSAYDAWQMGNILHQACIPAPDRAPCSAAENATLQAYYDSFLDNITAVTDGKPNNGVYIDSCYVHEQNVNYCSGQGMPNCVGWSPRESGSKKWGYSTNVTSSDGRQLTPQQAFGAYYRGDRSAFIVVDKLRFPSNPSCYYLGEPAPVCSDFSGAWFDNPHWFTPVNFVQDWHLCTGSFHSSAGLVNFTVKGEELTASSNFYNGLTGVLKIGMARDSIDWANGATWERNHTIRSEVVV